MQVGLDQLRSGSLPSLLRARRVALLAHPASVDRNLVHVSRVLEELDVRPVVIFGPEHGYGGEAQDMVGIGDARDAASSAPIISLYGSSLEDLVPKPEAVALNMRDTRSHGSRNSSVFWT